MRVHVLKPGLGGTGVVLPANHPVLFDPEIVLEIQQQIVGRHLASGKKVTRHPIRRPAVLVVVGDVFVGEDVDEEFAARRQRTRHLGHEQAVVLHVLEHLHGHHPIKPGLGLKIVHVGRDNGQVPQSAPLSLGIDVRLLGARIGDPGDPRPGILFRHPKGERSPAAPELQDTLAVGQLRALTRERQHAFLSLVEGVLFARPVTRAVFEPFAQGHLVKRGGHLVMLLVRRPGLHGNRALFEPGDVFHQRLAPELGRGGAFLAQGLAQQIPDPEADQGVGHRIGFKQLIECHDERREREKRWVTVSCGTRAQRRWWSADNAGTPRPCF